MSDSLKIVMAQENFLVGDIAGNCNRVIESALRASEQHGADIIVFPELTLTGYPPEDLLLRPSLQVRVEAALLSIEEQVKNITVVLGCPILAGDTLYNAAVVIQEGKRVAQYFKQNLPNYQVFDEVRYFKPGMDCGVFTVKGVTVGLTICEDIWFSEPVAQAKQEGAEIILNLNASPFHIEKLAQRKSVLAQRAQEVQLPIVYVNLVGGQDELVFDGASMVMNANGTLGYEAVSFQEAMVAVQFDSSDQGLVLNTQCLPDAPAAMDQEARIYETLTLGLRDYVNKNGFKGVVLGLSGGIDSGLSLAIAVDALGPERVEAIMMPFRYTSQISLDDAALEAKNFGASYQILPIEGIYDAFISALSEPFAGLAADKSEENLQARCRGTLLMAISNKKGSIVLTTGNKSEMAVGYATLYGDMVGGYNALKDVPKTLVFALSEYRNRVAGYPIIPQRMIDRPPSAELAPDQVDEDSLPPYSELDQILALYVEQDQSADSIVAQGFDRDVVYRITRLVDLNEYKRSQAPIGVRVTSRGFGKDRRYPITCKWPAGE